MSRYASGHLASGRRGFLTMNNLMLKYMLAITRDEKKYDKVTVVLGLAMFAAMVVLITVNVKA